MKTKEKPISFRTDMVQAIPPGHKTMTRRIMKPQPRLEKYSAMVGGYDNIPPMARFWTPGETNNLGVEDIKPKYQPGDILYVKETCTYVMLEHAPDLLEGANSQWIYKASVHSDWMDYAKERYGYKWKPSIFMPRAAARIFLKVTDVKAERLQDITEEDAIKEGIESKIIKSSIGQTYIGYLNYLYDGIDDIMYYRNPVLSFETLWIKINGPQSWKENPWVWVYSFEYLKNYNQ